MSDDGSVVYIALFAVVAVFLLFRLRAVLGRRTGEERDRPNPFDRPPIVPMPRGLGDQPLAPDGRPAVVIDNDPSQPLSLDARLARVRGVDSSFEEKHFLSGARAAFQMIVQAFASGDLATLRPLLSSHLYGEFGRAISARPRGAPPDKIEFVGPVAAEITDARVNGSEVQIQVRFASRQSRAGETETPQDETVDLWTFARDAGARDPNWQLVETAAGE
jgi:predicted lipid-binding transport protein (Tim44 family)